MHMEHERRAKLAKAALRNDVLKRRDAVDVAARLDFALRLAEVAPRLVFDFPGDGKPPVTALYSAIGSEADMMPLALALHAANVPLVLPVDWSSGTPLIYRRWRPGEPLAPGPLGIAEPDETAPEMEPDVLLVPLAAYDRGGRRLGYGAGNVDRTLTALRGRKPVRVLGVAYRLQEEPLIPSEPHDEPVDLVLTDRDILVCSG